MKVFSGPKEAKTTSDWCIIFGTPNPGRILNPTLTRTSCLRLTNRPHAGKRASTFLSAPRVDGAAARFHVQPLARLVLVNTVNGCYPYAADALAGLLVSLIAFGLVLVHRAHMARRPA
jgi:hypothetical protein